MGDKNAVPMEPGSRLKCRGVKLPGQAGRMEFYNAASGMVIGSKLMTPEEYAEWEVDGFPEDIPIAVEMDTREGH